MLVARVVAAAGLVPSLTLALGPAMAAKSAATHGGKSVIRRIEPTLPVAPPTQDASASIPAIDSTHGSLEAVSISGLGISRTSGPRSPRSSAHSRFCW